MTPAAASAAPWIDVQAHAARADDRYARTLRYPRGRQHRAHAGDDGAAERRERLERQRPVDHDGGFLGDDGVVREARGAQKLPEVLSARVQRRRSRRQAVLVCGPVEAIAEDGAAFHARGTGAAGRRPAEHDVIADFDLRDPGADFADDAGAFVPEDDRRARRPVVARRVQVAVTDARRLDLDEHLAGPRWIEIDLFDRERLPPFPEDGGGNLHIRDWIIG